MGLPTRASQIASQSGLLGGGQVYQSAAFTPPANSTLVLVVAEISTNGSTLGTTTVADNRTGGNAGTWTNKILQANSTGWICKLTVWTSPQGASPASMRVTSTHHVGGNDTTDYVFHEIVAWTGTDATTPFDNFVASLVASAVDGARSYTLATAPAVTSTFVSGLYSACEAGTMGATPGTDQTETYDAYTDDEHAYQSQIRSSSTSTSISWVRNVTTGLTGTMNGHQLILWGYEAHGTSGGTTYSVTQTETGTGADSPSTAFTALVARVETGAGADSSVATGGNGVGVGETGSAADVPNSNASMGVARVEAGAAAETVASTKLTSATVAEAGSALDVPGNGLPPVVTLKQRWHADVGGTGGVVPLVFGSNPCSIATGSTIIAVWVAADLGSYGPPTDANGTFTQPASSPVVADGSDRIWAGMAYQTNASGSHSITPHIIGSGGGGEADLLIIEVQNMPATATLRSGDIYKSSIIETVTTWSLTSGTEPKAGDLAMLLTVFENTVTNPTANLTLSSTTNLGTSTNLSNIQTGDVFIPTTCDWALVSADGAITTAYTTTDVHVSEHITVHMVMAPLVAGSIKSVAQVDSGTGSDAPASSMTGAVGRVETGTVLDAPVGISATSATTGETGSLLDAPVVNSTILTTTGETGNLLDASSDDRLTQATALEAGSALETSLTNFATSGSVSELENASEVASGSETTLESVSEVGTGSDEASTGSTSSATIGEQGAGSEDQSVIMAGSVITSELASAADLSTPGALAQANVNEGGNALESASTLMTSTLGILENMSASELVSCVGTIYATVVDNLNAAEVVANGSLTLVALIESGAMAESQTAIKILSGDVLEAVSLADNPAAIFSVICQAIETGDAVDMQVATGALTVALVEAVAAYDFVGQSGAQFATLGELVSASDLASVETFVSSLLRLFRFAEETRLFSFENESRSYRFPAQDEVRTYRFPGETRNYQFKDGA